MSNLNYPIKIYLRILCFFKNMFEDGSFSQRTHLSSCNLGTEVMGSGPVALQLMSCVPGQDTAFSEPLGFTVL